MLTDEIVAAYHRGKWALVVRGLLGIALGVFIFVRPLESVASFALVIAVWALVDGVVKVVHAFELRSVLPHWGLMLLGGLVSIVFGIAALYMYPVLSLSFAVVWAAWWLITGGALAIYIALEQRKASVSWGWTMTTGVVAVAAGGLALIYPAMTLVTLMGILAGFGIAGGVVLLIAAGKLQSFEDTVSQTVRSPSRA